MDSFDLVIKGAKDGRSKYEEEWGEMLYFKDAPDNDKQSSSKLFSKIKEVAPKQIVNIVLARHSDVFKYLRQDKLIDSRARSLMLEMLSAHYCPEAKVDYKFIGNNLRKVFEYVFRAAGRYGLVADECFDANNNVALTNCSKYMAGMTINCKRGNIVYRQVRWGKAGENRDGSGGDSVFPSNIAYVVKNALDYAQTASHTQNNKPLLIDEQNKELFFGYLMHLCYIIKWFGKYVKKHQNVEENKKKQVIIDI